MSAAFVIMELRMNRQALCSRSSARCGTESVHALPVAATPGWEKHEDQPGAVVLTRRRAPFQGATDTRRGDTR